MNLDSPLGTLRQFFKGAWQFYAPLDRGTTDFGTAGATGTVSGALASKGRGFRKTRQCYWYDGSNDRIDYAKTILIPNTDHTFFAWCIPSPGKTLVEHNPVTSGASVYASVTANRHANCAMYGGGSWNTASAYYSIYPGQWNFMAFSYFAAATKTVGFCNGYAGTPAVLNRGCYGGAWNTYIGGNANNADPAYQWGGWIGEVGVLKRSCSIPEIALYYRTFMKARRTAARHNLDYAPAAGGSAVAAMMNSYRRMRAA